MNFYFDSQIDMDFLGKMMRQLTELSHLNYTEKSITLALWPLTLFNRWLDGRIDVALSLVIN